MANTWLDGRLVEGPVALDPSDRGLTLGDGLFETIAVFNGRPAYLAPHLGRLEYGAKLLGIDVARSSIESGILELVGQDRRESGILRITITRGAGGRRLAGSASEPTRLITIAPWPKEIANASVRLATSSLRRNEHSPASRLKTLSYVDNILAAREAIAAGGDDALLLNTAGRVACSTISNLFVIDGIELITPPLAEGVLPGIIRARLLGLAKSIGLSAAERPLNAAELLTTDAVFLTNSVRLIRPVIAIDSIATSRAAYQHLKSLSDALCADMAEETGADPSEMAGINL